MIRHFASSRGLASLALVTLFGCGTPGPDPSPVTPITTEPADERSDLSLAVFDCGRILLDDVTAFGLNNEQTDVRELAVPCYVIEHPEGRMLWDSGLPSHLAETPGWQGEGMKMRLDRPLAPQLETLELTMHDFDFVAFSHLHMDHIGAAGEIKDATWLVQEADYDAAFGENPIPGFDPEVFGPLGDLETNRLDGDHDVFGDGRVLLLSAPGHTPGHQVLYLDLPQTGPVVLSGDLYIFRQARESRLVPSFNTDPEATLVSMTNIEKWIAEREATLWIQHELEQFEELVRNQPSGTPALFY